MATKLLLALTGSIHEYAILKVFENRVLRKTCGRRRTGKQGTDEIAQ
jgi:hypothetical protein